MQGSSGRLVLVVYHFMHTSTAPLPPSMINWSSPEPMDAADALSRGQCNMIRVPGAAEASVIRQAAAAAAALPGPPVFVG